MESELTRRFREKTERENTNLRKLAADLGLNYDRMYKWLKGKGNPKSPDDKIVEAWLNGKSSINIEQPPPEPATDTLPMQAIIRLISNTEVLSNSNAEAIHSNSVLVETNKRLADRVLELTANVDEQNLLAVHSRLNAFRELLFDVGVGTRWKSREEAERSLLNKLKNVDIQNRPSKGTQKNLDKSHK